MSPIIEEINWHTICISSTGGDFSSPVDDVVEA
jgi:hypothetical protein